MMEGVERVCRLDCELELHAGGRIVHEHGDGVSPVPVEHDFEAGGDSSIELALHL